MPTIVRILLVIVTSVVSATIVWLALIGFIFITQVQPASVTTRSSTCNDISMRYNIITCKVMLHNLNDTVTVTEVN